MWRCVCLCKHVYVYVCISERPLTLNHPHSLSLFLFLFLLFFPLSWSLNKGMSLKIFRQNLSSQQKTYLWAEMNGNQSVWERGSGCQPPCLPSTHPVSLIICHLIPSTAAICESFHSLVLTYHFEAFGARTEFDILNNHLFLVAMKSFQNYFKAFSSLAAIVGLKCQD